MNTDKYDIYIKKIGNNIRRLRTEKGMTMEDLSYEAEIEYRLLGRIERGEGNTTIITLIRISEVLKVDLHAFFIFDDF